MNILMTNDDGVNADGIVLLAEKLAEKGHNVTVCAPAGNRSASSHSITIRTDYSVQKINIINRKAVYYSIDARPVDCVVFGLHYLTTKFDLIISGINDGMNIGSDVIYSGTVGGAREGALTDVKSWAVSIFYADRAQTYPFDNAIEFLLDNFDKLLAMSEKAKTFLNINIPVSQKIKGMKVCSLARCDYDMQVDKTGENTYRLNGLPTNFEKAEEGSDIYYACQGYATVTPVVLDTTDYRALERMKNE